MPPKVTVTKDMIRDTAFALVQEQGMDSLNARALAQQLDCSTQPIFRAYQNMDQLRQDVIVQAEECYNQAMLDGMQHKIPFFGMGLAYIRFARQHPRLFALLFLGGQYAILSFDEMMTGEDNAQVIQMLAGATGGTPDQARRLYIATWLLTHGIATMLATNQTQIPDAEIEKILWDGYLGFKKQIIGDSTHAT